jgi:hypothetical protein
MIKLFTKQQNNLHQNTHQTSMDILASITGNTSTAPLSKRTSHITHQHIYDVYVDVSSFELVLLGHENIFTLNKNYD